MGTSKVDVDQLRRKYLDIQMPGMVTMIDFIVSQEKAGKHLEQIGSSTIVPPGLEINENASEAEIFETVFFKLKSFHLGSRTTTPLEDIENYWEAFLKAPQEWKERLDSVLDSMARSASRIGTTPGLVFDSDGIFLVPPDQREFFEKASPEERERFRVSREDAGAVFFGKPN
jgi:hypothetical protein